MCAETSDPEKATKWFGANYFFRQHCLRSKRAPFPWMIHTLSTGKNTRTRNIDNTTPSRGGTFAKKQAPLR
jgi:hypothetical protein